ncbi:MAG TPA: phosphate ABC transporter substrate-binding/OmpA family protein [Polyangiaceae bacterium]
MENEMRRWLGLVAATWSLSLTSSLSAQPQAAAVGMAEALFQDGRALLSQGSLELACNKLRESQQLAPAPGTLLSWADCEERRGHLASAWSLWLEAASAARSAQQLDRETLARGRAAALRQKLGTLTIEVPEAARVAELAITCDAQALGSAAWGTEAPIDAGEHLIVVSAPGRRELSQKVVVATGRAVRFRVPELALLEPSSTPAAAAPPLALPVEPAVSGMPASSVGFRWLAWLSGLGVLGLLGVLAWRSRRSSQASAATPVGVSPGLRWGWLLAGAGLLLALGGGWYLATRGTARSVVLETSAAAAELKVIRVAGDPWSGYSTFRGEPRLSAELAKAKLRIEYVDDPALYDQNARMQALAEGKIDAAVTTIDAFLQHGTKHRVNGQYPGVIVWGIDESNGGDAIFLDKGRKGFDSVLPTDKVCYSVGTPSEHLWDFASLSFANLGDKLATDNGVVASDCWKKLTEGKVQIAVLWQPTTAIALKAGYPKAFSTGGQADDVIIDVFVVGRAFLAKERAAITALMRSYFSVIDAYVKDPASHAAFITKDCGPDCEGDQQLGKAVLEGIDFLTYQENMCLWWGRCQAPAKMPERIAKTARLLTAKGKLPPEALPAASSILDDRALLQLEEEMKKQAELAAAVVGQDTKIDAPKLAASEKSYRYLAAAALGDPSREVGTLRLPNIYFPEGSASLDQNGLSVVNVIAEQLRAFPALCVHVYGYTSSSGNPDKNRLLSEARALSIVKQLTTLDSVTFQRSRFDVRGFGSSAPILRDSVEDFGASRRTEFKLFDCGQVELSAK